MNPFLTTHSGKRIDLLDPDPNQIVLEDIAYGLARQFRWNGQTDMTVAQHSYNVELVVAGGGGSLSQRIQAIFHDASEFILGDVGRPLKRMLPEYKAIENRLMNAIATRFDFAWPKCTKVQIADEIMLVTEGRHLMPPEIMEHFVEANGFPADLDPMTLPYNEWYHKPWSITEAEANWLAMAKELLSLRQRARN